MDNRNFIQKVQQFSDEELAEITGFNERDGYLPETVVTVRDQLITANPSLMELITKADSVETKRIRAVELASQPLSWPARVAFFILPVVGWPIMVFVAWFLGTRGYRQKSSEAWKWMGLGMPFWIGLVVVLFVLQLAYI